MDMNKIDQITNIVKRRFKMMIPDYLNRMLNMNQNLI